MSINSTPKQIIFWAFLLISCADLIVLFIVKGITLSRTVMVKDNVIVVPVDPKVISELMPAPHILRSMMDTGIDLSMMDP